MKRQLHLALWMLVNAAAMVSIAAVSPATPSRAGTFVWHDLVTDRPDTCRAFYTGLFGWTFEQPAGIPAVNRWLWMDYVAQDADAAVTFYSRAVGFSHQMSAQRDGFTYHMLSTDRPRAGLFATPWERQGSVWLPYVRVDDPAAMAARAKELGGTIFLPPNPRARNGSMAIVLDPSGAPIALQKFPFETGVTP